MTIIICTEECSCLFIIAERKIDLVYKLLDQVKAEIERNEGGLDTIDENPGTS